MTLECILRHPLAVAAAQLLVGIGIAYFFTERWQRWRQRRDFQYQTMTKLSATSMEMFVILSELLSIWPLRQQMADVWSDRQRRYITQRVGFHALEAEIMASFKQGDILRDYYDLNKSAELLFAFVQTTEPTLARATYEPAQQQFLDQRKSLLGRMIAEMKLLGWRERRHLQKGMLKEC